MTTITITDENQLSSFSPISSSTTIIIEASFTITNINNYITINGSNITINGQNNTLTVNVLNYPGLVQNTSIINTNIIIKNIIVVSSNTLASYNGWICQQGFCNGIISFCNSNGVIPTNGGGICGSQIYNCIILNCFSTGQIGQYAGGIIGSYSVNCNVSYSYSYGSIGNYGGGIFGFGTNYTFDGISYSPATPIDQDGNQINPLSTTNNNLVTQSTVIASYSMGSISSYAGGFFGYFAYTCSTTNCYSLGIGNILSGGIFAPNFYLTSNIIIPTATNCFARNCYTVGSNLSGDGIFAYNNTNITTNTKKCCYNEESNNWIDKHACKVLLNDLGSVWIDINPKLSNIPWLLISFSNQFYNPNYLETCNKYAVSSYGSLEPIYNIVNVNGCTSPCNITIDASNGQLYFNKVKPGNYKILVINGIKNIFSSNSYNYYTFTNYNFTNFYLCSKYKSKY
jgi:hypothetical protein